MATQSTTEMLVLVPGARAAHDAAARGDTQPADVYQASAWARAQVAQLLELDPAQVELVCTGTADQWLRRVLCPIGLHEERARAYFEATLGLVKAWRSSRYLSIANDLADLFAKTEPPLVLPRAQDGVDVAAFGTEFMRELQQQVGSKLLASAEVLRLLEELADLVSGQPTTSSSFLDLESMLSIPPTLAELEGRLTAHGSAPGHTSYWLIGLSVQTQS